MAAVRIQRSLRAARSKREEQSRLVRREFYHAARSPKAREGNKTSFHRCGRDASCPAPPRAHPCRRSLAHTALTADIWRQSAQGAVDEESWVREATASQKRPEAPRSSHPAHSAC